MYRKFISTCIILTVGLMIVGCEKNDKIQVNVSVTSSLKEPFLKIEKIYEKENKDIDLVINFGSSGSLTQQIKQGAPCDVFASASIKYMKDLEKEGYLLDNKYEELAKNRLVLVSNANDIKSIDDLKNDEYEKIGVGEINSVPVGQYANEVMTKEGIKPSIEEKLVYGKDAKEVLAWVVSGNVDAAFLYKSDTGHHKNLNSYYIDENLYTPIVYPVGIIKESKNLEQSIKFNNYLINEDTKKMLKDYGYTL